MRILITGGLGFIGINLARQFLLNGHEVVVIDNLSTQIHGDVPSIDLPDGLIVKRLDIRTISNRFDIVNGFDIVFHLAAETGTAQSMYNIVGYVDVNDCGTAALLEALSGAKKKPKVLVLASSRSVYGEGAYISPMDNEKVIQPESRKTKNLRESRWEQYDDDGHELIPIATKECIPFSPASVYAATKAAQELLVKSACNAIGIRPIILRFQNVYGEGQSLRNPYTGIISIFYNRIRQGLNIPIYEDGKESRDFIHISDVVGALVVAGLMDLPHGFVMNVGSGIRTTVSDLAELLVRVSGYNAEIETTGQYRLGDIRHCFADMEKAEREAGYTPKISLEEGLIRFCNWARNQPVHEDQLDAARDELRKKGLGN